MWTAQRLGRQEMQHEPIAQSGEVTVTGEQAGVFLDADRRWISVYSPGGYCWVPKSGQQVMVLKTGQEQESACIIGAGQKAEGLRAGEVKLYSEHGAQISLKNDGKVEIMGDIWVNGERLEAYIERISLAAKIPMGDAGGV